MRGGGRKRGAKMYYMLNYHSMDCNLFAIVSIYIAVIPGGQADKSIVLGTVQNK